MQAVLLHAKSSPLLWPLSWRWRVCCGSGHRIFSHSFSVPSLSCATWCSKSELCSMLPSICPICPTRTQHMATAQPLTPHFSPFCSLTFCHQCHQIPAFSTVPLHLPTVWKETLPLGLPANLSTPTYPPSFQPLPLSLTFALTLESHEIYIKTTLKKSIACIKAAYWAHLFSVSRRA